MAEERAESAGEHLAAIVAAFSALVRDGSTGQLAALLDPAVVWQGLEPRFVCNGRDQVLSMMGRRAGMELTRVEAQEFQDRVAISVEGPGLPENEVLAAGAPRSLVFTFSSGRITRIESAATRDAAFALAQRGSR